MAAAPRIDDPLRSTLLRFTATVAFRMGDPYASPHFPLVGGFSSGFCLLVRMHIASTECYRIRSNQLEKDKGQRKKPQKVPARLALLTLFTLVSSFCPLPYQSKEYHHATIQQEGENSSSHDGQLCCFSSSSGRETRRP